MAPLDPRRTALLAASALLLAGCTTSQVAQPPSVPGCTLPAGAVGIAAAGRANAPIVEATPSILAGINHAIDQQSHLTIVDTGGTPAVVQEGDLESTAKNGPAREDERKKNREGIGAALQGVRSTTPEANPLDALALAARSVKAHGETGTVVLADSGLQTTGALDYTKDGMLLADPDELAAAAKAAGQLPDLSGITVALTGIGDTVAPQAPLDNATRTRLGQQWVALANAAGATCVYLDVKPNAQASPAGAPDVSEITPPPPPVYDLDTPIPLREDVLDFKDNSPELIDPAAAQASLAALVTGLKASTGQIQLTGTTASGGTESGRQQLSAQRAQTAKELLVQMGIPAERITTKGVGTDFPGFQPDEDESGRQIPEIAAQNRSVIVVVKSE
jgi:outer membrane protein OmpA-like peptidoglycan-associated protein